MNKEQFLAKINENLRIDGRTDISHATPKQLHNALSRAVMDDIIPMWDKTEEKSAERTIFPPSSLWDGLYSTIFTARDSLTKLKES